MCTDFCNDSWHFFLLFILKILPFAVRVAEINTEMNLNVLPHITEAPQV